MDHIKLANCHVTQTKHKGIKGDWQVKDQQGNEIARLTKDLDDHKVMEVIHFARKFELEAFNAGIEFGKKTARDAISTKMMDTERLGLLRVCSELETHNTILAEKLDKFTREN